MKYKPYRYSKYINPLHIGLDLCLLTFLFFNFKVKLASSLLFLGYILFSWGVISFYNHFYSVERHTKVAFVLELIARQFAVFFIVLFAFIGFFKQPGISRFSLGIYLASSFLLISLLKFIIYYLLIRFRAELRKNIRSVIIIGNTDKAIQLAKTLTTNLELGYQLQKQINPEAKTFSLKESLNYVLEENIDEIYVSLSQVSNNQIEKLRNFADANLRMLKFIPDINNVLSKQLKFEYYGYVPILSFRSIPTDEKINKYTKRAFDIVFSLTIIVFVLSWLIPILGLLIVLDSKGGIFFKQTRSGINAQHFKCYKFRSMTFNEEANMRQATKGDMRITKIGRFIRNLSIDELPQFFNVLAGDMSVVGPRPHMIKHTNQYAKKVSSFMVRHYVKPGITGLAQVKGFRGEIENETDIIYRVRYDIFYIENWSLALDIKIIFQTIFNVFKGEKKAY